MELLGWVVLAAMAMLIAKIWLQSRQAQDRAMLYLRRECKKLQLQLLDDTVTLNHTRLKWRKQCLLVTRTFGFEFSINGADRYPAELVMNGLRVSVISGLPLPESRPE